MYSFPQVTGLFLAQGAFDQDSDHQAMDPTKNDLGLGGRRHKHMYKFHLTIYNHTNSPTPCGSSSSFQKPPKGPVTAQCSCRTKANAAAKATKPRQAVARPEPDDMSQEERVFTKWHGCFEASQRKPSRNM